MSLVTGKPQPGSPRPWQFPRFDRLERSGGQVLACHLPGRPLAVLSLVAEAGAMTEPAGCEGVAQLLTTALSEGSGGRDAYEFAVASERLGAAWRAGADWDSLRTGFEVPADAAVAAAGLLADAVWHPGLDSPTLQRVREERVDELRLDLSQPGPRAAAAFAAAVFDGAGRYALPDAGTPATVSDLTDDEVRGFHTRTLQPAGAALVVVGDLDVVDIDAVAAAVFADARPAAAAPARPAPVAPARGPGRVVLVDRPGSVQSMLYIGHDGPSRQAEDYVAMTTMSMILGGMFISRLNLRLREDKGYTYGAFASFDTRRDGGAFVARSAVQTEVTAPALVDALAEIRRLHEGGVTDDELELARNYRAGVFPINFAGPRAVAAGLGDLVVHGLPDDHFDRLRQAILDVDRAAVDTAARERLRPDELVAVVVGDAERVADELRAADVGPVEVLADAS